MNEKKAIAIAEFSTVSAGIKAADIMAKTADIELAESQVVCPGKYLIVVAGILGAVTTAVEASKILCGEKHIGSFILGNPHDSLLPAFYGKSRVEKIRALGVFETYDAASALMAADTAVKTAIVDLLELRLAVGMCGKSYVTISGEISAVEAAVLRAASVSAESDMLLDYCVIAKPDEKLERFLI